MEKQAVPETMLEAVRQFADPKVAHDFFTQIRFPNGVACPRLGCGSARVAYLEKQMRWYCNECKRQSSVKVGTIFEDSPIGFDKWLPAIWLLASNRNGISSCELARALKVTQKSAWFMLHRIRLAMESGSYDAPLGGIVEVDETYIGGKERNKPISVRRGLRSGNPVDDKTPVFGMVERGGNVRAWSLPENKARAHRVVPLMQRNIHHDATVYTDAASLYTHINEYFLQHLKVNHSASEYVRGEVHTNSIENFWSVLKRTLTGTYIAARPKHLDRYLAEQVFRFNERKNDDGHRFAKALKGADGRGLTYKSLVQKN
jgi:transposase-like protein